MEKKNQTVTQITEINGAMLTQSAINRIKTLQEQDNYVINTSRDAIADAVCFIGKNLDGSENQTEEIRQLITDLSFIRDYFTDLKKP